MANLFREHVTYGVFIKHTREERSTGLEVNRPSLASERRGRERKKERQEGVHQTHSSLLYVIELHTASARRLNTTPMLHVSEEPA